MEALVSMLLDQVPRSPCPGNWPLSCLHPHLDGFVSVPVPTPQRFPLTVGENVVAATSYAGRSSVVALGGLRIRRFQDPFEVRLRGQVPRGRAFILNIRVEVPTCYAGWSWRMSISSSVRNVDQCEPDAGGSNRTSPGHHLRLGEHIRADPPRRVGLHPVRERQLDARRLDESTK
jgi:hypothetical protein